MADQFTSTSTFGTGKYAQVASDQPEDDVVKDQPEEDGVGDEDEGEDEEQSPEGH